jgi:transglutaminase-like putative cysteine protease
MFFQIKHVTRYSYSQPVFCDPLTIRLRPREDPTQRLLRYRVEVWPEPAGQNESVDLAGNTVTTVWFHDVTLALSITTSLLCETLIANPYHFILDNDALRLPLARPSDDRSLLAYYLRDEEVSPVVQQFAESIAKEVNYQTVPFLSFLARTLYERTERLIREQGEAWPAELTLKDARGSCRDLAVLFNACCRSLGIAARFVSGYAPAETHTGPETYLHAWSEVYLPGAGWRGFDPSRGLAVADLHVPVAAGRTPREAAPTCGTFRGANARSQLQTQIAMSITSSDPRERWSAA